MRLSPIAQSTALTRLQLTVVLGIASVLLIFGLIMTTSRPLRMDVRRLEANQTCNQICVAINVYYAEYGQFPPLSLPTSGSSQTNRASADSIVGDPAMNVQQPNNTIFYTLRNLPKGPNENMAGNSRRILFFEAKAATLTLAGKPLRGFFDPSTDGQRANGDGCLYDPWGQQYGIILDTNGDGRIDLSGIYSDFAGVASTTGKAPKKRVGAFSMGKDKMLGTIGDRLYRRSNRTSDDVISWE